MASLLLCPVHPPTLRVESSLSPNSGAQRGTVSCPGPPSKVGDSTQPALSEEAEVQDGRLSSPKRCGFLPQTLGSDSEACPRPPTPTAPIPSLPHPQALVFCLSK